jgi:hypothetical protein
MEQGKSRTTTSSEAQARLPLSDGGRVRLDPTQERLGVLRRRFTAACARFELYPLAERAAKTVEQRLANWHDRAELAEFVSELEQVDRSQLCTLLHRYADYLSGFGARPEIVHFFGSGFTVERVSDERDRRNFADCTICDDPEELVKTPYEFFALRQPTGEPDVLIEIRVADCGDFEGGAPANAWIIESLSCRWDPNEDFYAEGPDGEQVELLIADSKAISAAERHLPVWFASLREQGIVVCEEDYGPPHIDVDRLV